MRNQNGDINVESTLGKGSCFIIDLPFQKEVKPDDKKEINKVLQENPINEFINPGNNTETEFLLPGPREYTILIVEDNQDIVSYLEDAFSGEYRVLTSENGKMALAELKKHIPDVIISDIMMPEVDGIELCKIVKSDEKLSHIPIVLITAKAGEEEILSGLENGADDYIIKPFSIKEVKARVKNLILQRERILKKFNAELDSFEPESITHSNPDEVFLKEAMKIVEQNMSNPEFTSKDLVEKLNLSRSLVFLKLKKITGTSASQFITAIRLRTAAKLLKNSSKNISEIAFAVGFNDHAYFTRLFKKIFHLSPSEYARKKMN